jgi:hypothetical protein
VVFVMGMQEAPGPACVPDIRRPCAEAAIPPQRILVDQRTR